MSNLHIGAFIAILLHYYWKEGTEALKNFIEEFYYGNIEPQGRSKEQSPAAKKEFDRLTKNEELLTQALTDENKKLFLEYVNAWGVVNGESSADSFAVGFRLGAAFVYDTFVAGSIPTYDK